MPSLGSLQATYRLIQPRMEELDELLGRTLRSDVACVDEILAYASRYSGKKLRPALVLLIGDICGGATASHVKLGAVVEMIHLATLVHDDVLDRAAIRRNAASINERWSNKDAVLLGDIIFARAINLLVTIGDRRALELLTESVATICEGEIQQNQLSRNPALDVPTYMEIIRRKTASLYGAGCELAASLSGAEPAVVEAFAAFGLSLGTAFQIIDDCLDLTGEEQVVGKSLGTDVLNGKMTLPLIHLLASVDGADRQAVEAAIRADGAGPVELKRIRSLLEEHGSVSYALQRATSFVEEALEGLRPHLEPADYNVIEGVAGFVLDRRS